MFSKVFAVSALIGALAASLPAAAIVIRHDRESSAYEQSETAYPAVFALYRTRAGHRDCVATLVAPQWAITAAHCTQEDRLTNALAGEGFRVELMGHARMIDRVERHESADIALLHLSRPVTGVEPIALYRFEDERGRTVVMPGWGGYGNGTEGLGTEDGLFRVAENIVDAANDGWLIWRFDDPRSAIGNALALEGISGPGDSGGPALIATPRGYSIAGVSSRQRSFGRPEGVYGAEEYFVRVSQYLPWIDATISAR